MVAVAGIYKTAISEANPLMPLVLLKTDVEDDRDFVQFNFAHARDHDEIDSALLARGVLPIGVPLDPVPLGDSGANWLLLHQQKHAEMNGVFGIAIVDLTQFDLRKREDRQTFVGLNFADHDSIHQALGI